MLFNIISKLLTGTAYCSSDACASLHPHLWPQALGRTTTPLHWRELVEVVQARMSPGHPGHVLPGRGPVADPRDAGEIIYFLGLGMSVSTHTQKSLECCPHILDLHEWQVDEWLMLALNMARVSKVRTCLLVHMLSSWAKGSDLRRL